MNASVDDVREFVAESREAALAMAESYFRATGDQLETWVVPPTVHIAGLGERVLLIAAPRSERSGRPPEPRREERRPAERERERSGGRDRDRDRDRGGRDRGAPRSEARSEPRPEPRTEPRSEPRTERPARSPRAEREERDTPAEPERRPEAESESPRTAKATLGQVGVFVAGILERMKLRDVTVSESETDDGEIIVTLDGRAITSLAEREPRLVAALSHLGHRAAEALIDDDAAAQVEIRGVRRAPREEPRERGGRDSRREPRREGGRGDRPSRPRDPEDRDIDEVELERLAKDAARSVRESGEPELLPPMNSRERWFVHNALKEERGVRSESEGEGARKRVKILPA
jgi:predicted RNA-binding protein Jag